MGNCLYFLHSHQLSFKNSSDISNTYIMIQMHSCRMQNFLHPPFPKKIFILKPWQQGCSIEPDLHVLHCNVLQDLTVVHIPHGLVIPDLRRQQYCTQHNTLPVGRHNINFSIVEQSLQVNLQYAMSNIKLLYEVPLHVYIPIRVYT